MNPAIHGWIAACYFDSLVQYHELRSKWDAGLYGAEAVDLVLFVPMFAQSSMKGCERSNICKNYQ